MITEKQQIDRTKGIGSSDVPTILGLNPWATAHDLWLFKTGQVPGVEENEAMRIGTLLEEGVLKLASARLGVRIVKPTSTFVGSAPFMRANIDGMIGSAKRGSPIVEAKTTGRTDEWGAEGTDEVPEGVRSQVMFQMLCSSSDLTHIACLQGDHGLRLKMYRVAFCSAYAGYIHERVSEFWERVQTKTPPNCAASVDVLKQIRRIDTPSVAIPRELFQADADAHAVLKSATAFADSTRAALLTALGQSRAGHCDGFSIRVSQVETSRFDSKTFAAENPDIAAKYTVQSGYPRVTVSNKGEKQ